MDLGTGTIWSALGGLGTVFGLLHRLLEGFRKDIRQSREDHQKLALVVARLGVHSQSHSQRIARLERGERG